MMSAGTMSVVCVEHEKWALSRFKKKFRNQVMWPWSEYDNWLAEHSTVKQTTDKQGWWSTSTMGFPEAAEFSFFKGLIHSVPFTQPLDATLCSYFLWKTHNYRLSEQFVKKKQPFLTTSKLSQGYLMAS